jgi:glyoxylase-like metal-dependent hydrolase (beta-lactamase superfamily II)
VLDGRIRVVTPGVIQAPVPWGSVFVLLDRRVTLVDAGARGSAGRILQVLRRLGRSADDIERIIVTHAHPDHAGGLAALRRVTAARTAAHALAASTLRGDLAARAGRPVFGRQVHVSRLLCPPAPIDRELHDREVLPVLGGLQVLHLPGHTPGHIGLYLPTARLLIAGDAMQIHSGRLTGPSAVFTEDMARARASLAALASLDIDVLALSHFPPRRGDLRREIAAAATGSTAARQPGATIRATARGGRAGE